MRKITLSLLLLFLPLTVSQATAELKEIMKTL